MPNNEQTDWNDVIKGVKKLPKNVAITQKPKKEITVSKEFSGVVVISKSTRELLENDFADIDRSTATKMDRGEIRPDVELDLHGITREAAFSQVKRVVSEAYISRRRMILIITGKGIKKDYKSVLREELPSWLNHESIKPMILRFSRASIKDGGSGAFYVLIRRKR